MDPRSRKGARDQNLVAMPPASLYVMDTSTQVTGDPPMKTLSRSLLVLLLVSFLTVPVELLHSQEQALTVAPQLTRAEMEEFLLRANVVKRKGLSQGVTASERATLTDGRITHDAHLQVVDIRKNEFDTPKGKELNFRDTYKFNIAAYRLDKILELNMIPVSVERKVAGNTAAVTWWIDDVLMTELDRYKKKTPPPFPVAWNHQKYTIWVFDELIYNTDRNLGNMVISKDWKLWMIDHTRAFRLMPELLNSKNLMRCDRKLLANIRKLDQETLIPVLTPYLTKEEIKSMLVRRDKIVKLFDTQIAEKGENAVLFDLPQYNSN